jgi:hypothetical protein
MADPPRYAQPSGRSDDGVHQLLGMQIALHQQRDLDGAGKRDRVCRGQRGRPAHRSGEQW